MAVYRHLCAIALVCAMATALSAQNNSVATPIPFTTIVNTTANTTPSTTTSTPTTNVIQTGYVVVTPTDGIPDGLVVFGDLTLTSASQSSQGIFAASALVNAAAVPINTDSSMLQNTGVAIVNPNTQAVNIMLVLRMASTGSTPLTTNFSLGAGQQTSKFVTEVFGNQTIAQGAPNVLTIVANLPVGVVGFNFQGTNFAAVPVTDLTSVLTMSALASLNSDISGTTNSNTTTGNVTTSNTTSSSLKAATIAGTNVEVSNTTPPGQFFPQISTSVGGNGAQILPQLAMNGGWTTTLILVNPSSISRTVRLDFFDATGAPLNAQFQNGSGSSFTNVTIPASGTVVISAANSSVTITSGNINTTGGM